MGIQAQSGVAATTLTSTLPADAVNGDQAPSAPAFEQILQELEALVTQLESGDLPLDEALRTFERGVRLTRECQSALTVAQQKVQLLLQRGESVVLEEFDARTVESVSTTRAGADGALAP